MTVEQEVTCRVCGRPRGENVAHGTREETRAYLTTALASLEGSS